MQTSGFSGILNRTMEWLMRLAYLNIIWILFTVIGLGIFTIFPATAAALGIARKWVRKEDDFPVFRTYWTTFRKEFWHAQALGGIFLIAGIVLYVDYIIFAAGSTSLLIGLKYITFVLIFFYFSVLIFLFPVLVHYEMTFFQAFKTAFFLGFLRPTYSLLIISVLGILLIIMFKLPGLLPFFGVSIPFLWITIVTQKLFEKVALKYRVT
ncbi:YesL family protein [Pseudogracilibacillus auburnensis]|uniref:YesL family protein n=1 Tax=Pseudogracilibacillus auburnensis TaxID=1494959 RepID=UPI001A97742E|nr:YesL family protein [Pseudogracilibacillus auburnensis]MBO1004827.1 YesL family protein [Pseudogracilibacillus auburnensis]